MTKNKPLLNLLKLNLALILISTSGVLGRSIDLSVPLIIFFRAGLAGLLIFIYCKWKKIDLRILKPDKKKIALGGVLLGLHWITYFQALQISNVAIGMLSLFTYPVITSVLEPLILKTKFLKIHFVLGLMVLVGIYFLVPKFDLEHQYFQAVGWGILSAFCFALRNIYLKNQVAKYNGSVIMLYQVVVVTICLSPFLLTNSLDNLISEVPSLLVLAMVTTAIGHTLFLMSFKNFSVATASVISSLQPVYGILFGMVILSEFPSKGAIIGGGLILCSVLLECIRHYRLKSH